MRRYVYVSEYVQRGFSGTTGRDVSKASFILGELRLFDRPDDRPIPNDCIGMVYRLESDKLNEQAIDVFVKVVQQRANTQVLIVGGRFRSYPISRRPRGPPRSSSGSASLITWPTRSCHGCMPS